MKHIIHDWSDEHCRTILKLMREKLPAGGRALVCEMVVTDEPGPTPAKMLDIEMLVMTVGGKELVESAITTHKATRLTIQMTGRAIPDSTPDKPFNMPTLDAVLYIEPDVGVVQVRNSQGQGWKLQEHEVD